MFKANSKAVLLLSIMVPLGLLAGFKLSGIITQPQTPEAVTLEAVTWNMTRPTRNLSVDEWVNSSSYTDDNAFSGVGIAIGEYLENDPQFPAEGNDFLEFTSVVTVNVDVGFVYSVVVNFTGVDANACIILETTSDSFGLQNVTVKRIVNPLTSALLLASATNQSREISLSTTAYWVFLDQNDADHWINIDFEATYFNGTAYRSVMTPFVLGMLVR